MRGRISSLALQKCISRNRLRLPCHVANGRKDSNSGRLEHPAAGSLAPFLSCSSREARIGLAIRLVLARLFGIEAKDVAPAVYLNFFDLQRRRIFRGLPLGVNLPVRSGPGDHFLAHLLYIYIPHAQGCKGVRFQGHRES